MGEWFYNAGLIGFIRIYDEYKKGAILKEENYIEFDSDILKDFHNYYFDYFMNKYNVAQSMSDAIDRYSENIKVALNDESGTKDKKELKDTKKRFKERLKYQLDKIKKYNERLYSQMLVEYNKIDSLNSKADIDMVIEIANNLKILFNDDEINKKLTSNIFKNFLSDQYFGQVSFFNVAKSSLSFNEQKKLMYKDFISNIIENAFLNDILNDRYSIDEINEHINKAIESQLINKSIEKVFKNISKLINKNATFDAIKKYIHEDVLKYCSFCESMSANTDDFSEGYFIPLAMSSTNAKNFFSSNCSITSFLFKTTTALVTLGSGLNAVAGTTNF